MTNTETTAKTILCGHIAPDRFPPAIPCQLPVGHEYGHWYAKLVTAETVANTKRLPTTSYWCHECKQCRDCEGPNHEDDNYWCNTCGHRIQCDECGQAWTDDHACDGDEEEALQLDREAELRRQDEQDRPEANWFYAKDSGRDLSRGAV